MRHGTRQRYDAAGAHKDRRRRFLRRKKDGILIKKFKKRLTKHRMSDRIIRCQRGPLAQLVRATGS